MIPKTMHFFWCGERMSWFRYSLLATFKKLNPDWRAILHTASVVSVEETYVDKYYQDFLTYDGPNWLPEVSDLGIEVQDYKIGYGLDETLGPVFKADISRWQILWKEGGFYSDTDILYTRPMSAYVSDKVLKRMETVVFLEPYILIGFLAASPNNQFYRDVFVTACKSLDPTVYESAGSLAVRETVKAHNGRERALKKLYPMMAIDFLSHHVVYPFTYKQHTFMFRQMTHEAAKLVNRPGCIGIHLFGGSKAFSMLNNRIGPHNYGEMDNVVAHYLKGVLG